MAARAEPRHCLGDLGFSEPREALARKLFQMSDWTFLSDYAHVLIALARDPRSDAATVARATGLDVKVVGTILRDLEADGYIRREPEGSTEFTFINRGKPLRHKVERNHTVGRLLDAVKSPGDTLRDRLASKD
jgi:DprA winged helix domain